MHFFSIYVDFVCFIDNSYLPWNKINEHFNNVILQKYWWRKEYINSYQTKTAGIAH